MKKSILVAAVFLFAIASAFTTKSHHSRFVSPYGANPYSLPVAGVCTAGAIVNDPNGICQDAVSKAVVCQIRFTSGSVHTDVNAYDGLGQCGVASELITRDN